MKNKMRGLLLSGCLFLSTFIYAQKFNNPVDYMQYMSEQYEKIKNDSWSYTSAVAHGKSAKKVEKKRNELSKTITEAKSKISKMGGYDGNTELKDSVISYLEINYHVINDDYAKIVDMEEISEQSFDAMEAYLMAQDIANDKIKMAGDMVDTEQMEFAKAHNITIQKAEDQISKNIEIASEVFDYYRITYLIFFKSYKQEAYLMNAVERADISGIEQNKNTLKQYTIEGLEKLKNIKNFKGDVSLKLACTDVLKFYQEEAEKDIDVIIDFHMKSENFNKLKTAFEAKKDKDRTKEDIDKYNASINSINEASNNYNKLNNDLFNERSKLINTWNNSVTSFLDKHTPKGK